MNLGVCHTRLHILLTSPSTFTLSWSLTMPRPMAIVMRATHAAKNISAVPPPVTQKDADQLYCFYCLKRLSTLR